MLAPTLYIYLGEGFNGVDKIIHFKSITNPRHNSSEPLGRTWELEIGLERGGVARKQEPLSQRIRVWKNQVNYANS